MNIIAGIIATINPHQKDALVAGMVVVGVVLLATFAKGFTGRFSKAE
jgi:hypothetical protein